MDNFGTLVAKTTDLADGEMKKVAVNGIDVVLARIDGQFYAVYGKCSHYDAPLHEGGLNGCRLVCPWHHACFDVRTGQQLESPGLDGLATFEVRTEGEDIYIQVPERVKGHIPNKMTALDPSDDRTYLIVGGGAAGAYAAEGLREAGYGGKIVLLTQENTIPYDRPDCSKGYLAAETQDKQMPLRSHDFYIEHGIDIRRNSRVTHLDAAAHTLTLADGKTMTYDKVLVCSGSQPRRLDLPGADSKNVHTLRSMADAHTIQQLAKQGQRAVVIGASFIGMEAAMSIQKLGVAVSVVAPDTLPFGKLFGEAVGREIKQRHEAAGIEFHLEQKVKTIQTDGEQATGVVLDNGTQLEADLIVVGIGVTPNTDFIENAPRTEDGGLVTDAYLHVASDMYAAGDVARYPYLEDRVRIEHWKVASQQGRVAGRNLAGANEMYQAIPFFWTAQQDLSLRYVGHVDNWDAVTIDGEVADGDFLAYYVQDDQIKAVLGAGRDREMIYIQEAMYEGILPSPDAVQTVDWSTWVKKMS